MQRQQFKMCIQKYLRQDLVLVEKQQVQEESMISVDLLNDISLIASCNS